MQPIGPRQPREPLVRDRLDAETRPRALSRYGCRRIGILAQIGCQQDDLLEVVRLALAMVCISVCDFIGLSR